jgi:hypothetical protein
MGIRVCCVFTRCELMVHGPAVSGCPVRCAARCAVGVCRGKGRQGEDNAGRMDAQGQRSRHTRRRHGNPCSTECAPPPVPQPCAPDRCAQRTAGQGNHTNARDNSLHRRRRAWGTQAGTNRVANASSAQVVQRTVRVPGNFGPILYLSRISTCRFGACGTD